ncbi:hypothetical protein CHU98_g11279 [Xylaria longipes]|nr:hypothetical protein CHU98_g11279 [Xylaria longipes]
MQSCLLKISFERDTYALTRGKQTDLPRGVVGSLKPCTTAPGSLEDTPSFRQNSVTWAPSPWRLVAFEQRFLKTVIDGWRLYSGQGTRPVMACGYSPAIRLAHSTVEMSVCGVTALFIGAETLFVHRGLSGEGGF